jgi:hypothetical protein
MRKPTDHHLSALKHGAFSRVLILPWESVAKFAELYGDLIAEWEPVGRTEQDAVLSIAKGIWRKRRMQAFLRNELEKHSCDPNHVAYNEAEVLRGLYHAIETAPDKFETWLSGLPTQKANDLRRKFPREDFQSDSDWVKAVQHEIASNLLPAVTRFGSVENLVAHSASVLFTDEAIEYDIGVEERIDAMIDRAIKRLVQTKAMKQMLGFSTIENRDQLKSKRPSNGKPNGSVSRDSHACTADSQHSKPRK